MSEQLKYKMYNHKVIPPGDVWNAIQEELEPKLSPAPLADKIYAYEVPAPPDIWQLIAKELNTETPVRSIATRQPLKWVAAAAIFVFLVSGAYYFINSGSKSNTRMASAGIGTNTDTPKRIVPLAGNIAPIAKTKTTSPSSGYANYMVEKTAVHRERERPLHSSRVEDADLVPEEEVVVHAHQIRSESGEPIHDMSIVNPSNDKYISITAPNGQQTKISSKLAIAMPYLGFLISDGQNISETSWKERIEEWRARIIQSGFVPSSGNFLDIMEFTDLIED